MPAGETRKRRVTRNLQLLHIVDNFGSSSPQFLYISVCTTKSRNAVLTEINRIMPFKTPDGKEFESRAEWRDYMMATFFSFKNKVNEPNPCVKEPGSIDGQMFDIGDCSNSSLVVMDHTEQVQIDELKNCRVFIGACASSLFIRNCSNCTFYTCCRQLRLRDVTDCKFYVYSMSEVHIEYSTRIAFAPFNGGYPEQARHLASAGLDVGQNLWYDIFDHNDPAKTHENWRLLDDSEREKDGWFPAGPCERAIPVTTAGYFTRTDQDAGMQSFGADQLMKDAASSPKKTQSAAASTLPAAPPTDSAPPIPPPAGAEPNPRVGIIGTGNVGIALAGRFLTAGWPVCFGTAHPASDKTKEAVNKLNNDSVLVTTPDQACMAADIIVLAMPGMRSVEACVGFASSLGEGVAGKVIIDATNPLSEFPQLEVMWDGNTSGGEIMQQAFPMSVVFKAFNTIGSEHMIHPDGSLIEGYDFSKRGPLKMMFCGPEEHQEVAAEVISAVGFSPQYIGPMRYARNLEAIGELWVHLAVPPAGSTSVNWGRGFHFEPTGR